MPRPMSDAEENAMSKMFPMFAHGFGLVRRLRRLPGSTPKIVLLTSLLCGVAHAEDASTAHMPRDTPHPIDETSSSDGEQPASSAAVVEAGAEQRPDETEGLEQARAEAAERFSRGLGFYRDGDYALALIEFDRAYQLVPDYRVLYNIGQVSIQLSRFARARAALEQYLKEGGASLSDERTAAVEADLRMLVARTAFLNLEMAEGGAEVFIDDRSYGVTPLREPILLAAGEHRLLVRKPGFEEASQRLTLAGAEELTLEISLVQLSPQEPIVVATPVEPQTSSAPTPPPAAPVALERRHGPSAALIGWITTGTLAAGAVVTGVLGLAAKADYDELDSTPNLPDGELESAAGKAQALLTTADVLGAAALVSGGVSLYLTLRKRPTVALHPAASQLGSRVSSEPRTQLVVSPSRISLQGRF